MRPFSEERPILLFRDGACEQEAELVTHGAVFVDPDWNVWEFFGDKVPQPFLRDTKDESVKSSLVRSYSPSIYSLGLLRLNARIDAETQSWSWYTRLQYSGCLEAGLWERWTQVHPNDGHALDWGMSLAWKASRLLFPFFREMASGAVPLNSPACAKSASFVCCVTDWYR